IVTSMLGFTSPHVEIVPSPTGQPVPSGREPLASGPVLQGESSQGIEASLPKAERLIDNVNRLALQMTELTGRFNRIAANPNRERLGSLLVGLQDSLKTLNATLLQAQSLVADPELRANFQQTAANVRDATENLKLVTRDVQSLTGDPAVQGDLRGSLSMLHLT